jgi:hypothetical protein
MKFTSPSLNQLKGAPAGFGCKNLKQQPHSKYLERKHATTNVASDHGERFGGVPHGKQRAGSCSLGTSGKERNEEKWGGLWGSNPRPSGPQPDALPTELKPP